MKNLLLLLCLICSTVILAQTDSSTTELTIIEQVEEATGTVTEVVEGIEKISGNVWQALEELAKALEVPATHIYRVIIRQQTVKAITELIVWFLMPFIITLMAFYWTVKKWKLYTQETIDDTEGGSLTALFLIVIPVVFMVFGCDWSLIVTGFVNPEFGALTDITEMVQTLTQ